MTSIDQKLNPVEMAVIGEVVSSGATKKGRERTLLVTVDHVAT